jgi:uncharacterized protein YqhQ
MTATADTTQSAAVRLPDGRLMSPKDAPLGGQAVLEGVMMRGVATWAVAVRKPVREQAGSEAVSEDGSKDGVHADGSGNGAGAPDANGPAVALAPAAGIDGAIAASENGEGRGEGGDDELGEIEVHLERFEPWVRRHKAYRIPVVRGVVALVESLKIGFRALGISANAQLDEEEGEELSGRAWGITIFVSMLFAVGLFFVLPVTIANFWKDSLGSSIMFVIVEKLIRISIFLGYLWIISKLPDMRRVFEYHGAEHKVIAAFEAGDELTPERASLYSRLHVRCGTSFLLIVIVIAVFVFAPVGRPALYWLILSRVLGIAVVAGLAYEVIKFAGRNRRKRWVRALMWPGLQLQKLTTREPSFDQLAVSIAALKAVLAVEDPRSATAEDRVGMEVVA